MSGIDTRSGFRKRSNSRSNLSGQTSVMPSAYATSEPAAEPRPGPTGMPRSRAASMKSCDDEEVAGVARLGDDAELVVQPLARPSAAAACRSAAPRPAAPGPRAALRRSAYAGGAGEAAAGSSSSRSRTRRGRPRSGCWRASRAGPGRAPHLLLGLDVRLLAGEAESLRVVEVAAGADGQQHVVRLGVLAPQVVGVVRRDDADAQLLARAGACPR